MNENVNVKFVWNGSSAGKNFYRMALELPSEDVPRLTEENYKTTSDGNYFYVKNGAIYAYISTEVGGAITFLGKGRWSGNPTGLGRSLGEDLIDVSINWYAGYALNRDVARKLAVRNGYRLEAQDFGGWTSWRFVKG